MRTVIELVDSVHAAATDVGMDLSVADVGFIISSFLEGLIHSPGVSEVNAQLQSLADEVSRAK